MPVMKSCRLSRLRMVILPAVIVLFAACRPIDAPPPTPAPVDIAPLLAEAETLRGQGAYAAALEKLAEARAGLPDNPAPLLATGQIYLAQHRWQPTADSFQQALARRPNSYEAAVGLAEARLAQGQHVESRNVWRQAIAINNQRPEAWAGLGRAWLAAGDFEQARQALKQAQAAGLGETAWLLAALTLPLNVDAGRTWLAVAPAGQPQARYLREMMRGVDKTASQADVAARTGIALIQLQAWQPARFALETATRLAPAEAHNWAFLGHVQGKLGLPALESFARAKSLDPSLVLTFYFEGIYLRTQHLYDAALDRFLQAMDLDPQNLAVAIETAYTLAEASDLPSAEAWYQAVVQAEPDSADYQRLLTEFYVERSYHIVEAGLPAAGRLVELAPTDARAFDLLGWARFQTGDMPGAEESLRQAVTLDETLVSARYHLGRVLKAQRKNVEAQAEFAHVLDWDTSGQYRNRLLKGND